VEWSSLYTKNTIVARKERGVVYAREGLKRGYGMTVASYNNARNQIKLSWEDKMWS